MADIATTSSEPAIATSKYWPRMFWTLWYGQCLATAGLTVVVPQIPLYIQQLDGGNSYTAWWSGLCLLAPAVTQCIAAPLWGQLADRWGYKWMVVRALSGLALCMGLMALVWTPWQFLLCRLFQGACGGVVEAAASFVGTQTTQDTQGRVLGRLQSSTAAGSLVGPLAGSVLVSFWGYRPLFLLMALLTASGSLLTACVLHEQTHEEHKVECCAPPSLTQTISSLIRQRRIRALFLAGLCAQTGIYGLVVVMALHIEQRVGNAAQAALWIGILQGITWGAALFGSPWWGRRNERVPVERNVVLACVGCGLSIALQALPQDVTWLMPLRFVQGFCFSALLPSIFLKVQQVSKEEDYSTRIGFATSVFVLGQITGALIGAGLPGLLGDERGITCMGLLFLAGATWLWYVFSQSEYGVLYIKTSKGK